jgi:uncharacterized protein YydD (DUF2326 family)
MIYKIYSELPTFKKLEFQPGLNIILATKTQNATDQQTRNGAGKSSFVELVHFLLGGNCKSDSIFKVDELKDYHFGIELDLTGKIDIQRHGEKPSKLILVTGNSDKWISHPKAHKKSGELIISNSNWSEVLGDIWFDVASLEETENEEESSLSYRQLFSYFARKQGSGGFEDPFKFFGNQYPVSIQSCMFYFIGLDQYLPQKWNFVREREKTIRELKTAVSNGLFKDVVQSTSNLRTQIAITEKRFNDLNAQIKEYKVLPEYEKIETEASALISEINEHSNQDTIDRHILDDLIKSLQELPEPDMEQVEAIYKEAGMMFPNEVTKRLDELVEFHRSVYKNRKNYLESDISSLKNKISDRSVKKKTIEDKYASNMSLLQSHGALDTYTRLTTRRDEASLKLSAFKDQFDVALSLETNKTRLESERADLMSQLVNEYSERATLINSAITTFESISSLLYEEAGSLHIGESLNGPTFDIKIHGERSKGIRNIQIFCLDMTIMLLLKARGKGPNFLIHDSHIFDGVDERQIAKALEIGKNLADQNGFQYIVTMNSDTFSGMANNFTNKMEMEACILPEVLTDESDTGGLFGLRFK